MDQSEALQTETPSFALQSLSPSFEGRVFKRLPEPMQSHFALGREECPGDTCQAYLHGEVQECGRGSVTGAPSVGDRSVGVRMGYRDRSHAMMTFQNTYKKNPSAVSGLP